MHEPLRLSLDPSYVAALTLRLRAAFTEQYFLREAHDGLLAAAKLAAKHFEYLHAADVGWHDDAEHEAWTALQTAISKAEGR